MEQFISLNVRQSVSTHVKVVQGQQQSQIAPTSTRLAPLKARRNRGNVHELPFNNPQSNVPNIHPTGPFTPPPGRIVEPPKRPPALVDIPPCLPPPPPNIPQPPRPPQTSPRLPQTSPRLPQTSPRLPQTSPHLPQTPPPQNILQQRCGNPRRKKRNPVPTVTNENAMVFLECVENRQSCEAQVEQLWHLIAANNVKIKDLTKLSDDQQTELRKTKKEQKAQELNYQEMDNFYRGEITRLRTYILECQKKEEEYKARIASQEENDSIALPKLKGILDFMRKFCSEYKKTTPYVTLGYMAQSKLEEDQPKTEETSESTDDADIQSLIQQLNDEKNKFSEAALALDDHILEAFQGCKTRIEELQAEIGEKLVEKKLLRKRKVTGSFVDESGNSGASSCEDEEWYIVTSEAEDEDEDEVEQYDGENGERPETPPPVLRPYNVDTWEDEGQYHNKVKRRRTTGEGSSSQAYHFEGFGYESDQVRSERGGKKKKGTALGKKNKISEATKRDELFSRKKIQRKGEKEKVAGSKKRNSKPGKGKKDMSVQTDLIGLMNRNEDEKTGNKFIEVVGSYSKSFWERCCTKLLTTDSMTKDYNFGQKSDSNEKKEKVGEIGNLKNSDKGKRVKKSKRKNTVAVCYEIVEGEEDELLDL